MAKQEEQMQYLMFLRTLKAGWTPELRKEFLEFFVSGTQGWYGGFGGGLGTLRTDAISQIPPEERAALQSIIDQPIRGGARGGGGGVRGAGAGPAGVPPGAPGAAPAGQ